MLPRAILLGSSLLAISSSAMAQDGPLMGMGCLMPDAVLIEVGPLSPNAEHVSMGYVCQHPAETTQSIAPQARMRGWVGVMGADPEKSTLGFTEGDSIRQGDDDE